MVLGLVNETRFGPLSGPRKGDAAYFRIEYVIETTASVNKLEFGVLRLSATRFTGQVLDWLTMDLLNGVGLSKTYT